MALSEVLGGGEVGNALATLSYGTIPDVTASRYVTDPMKRIWAPAGTVVIERYVQLVVMQAQSDLGVDIPQSHIDDYREKLGVVDLDEIREEEAKSSHDVNARIKVFNRLAGHQDVGEAMTSRDSTDPSEQFQKRLAFEIIRMKSVAAISRFARSAAEHAGLAITGRTHNVVAQMTTLGKRFANHGEEMLDALALLSFHVDNMKLRGIKGAVGTQQDMLDLFNSDEDKVDELDRRLAEALGFSAVYNSVGQIYPRSQDLAGIQALSHVVAPLSNFATNVRHMMGDGLMRESSKKRVGSNAMPHKINPRTSERITAFYHDLGGMEAELHPKAGEQWLEGDVSDSYIRRKVIPGSFFAADGAFEAALTILDDYRLFPNMISNEIERNLPFLSTTKVLTTAIKRGMGREDAHETIRQHAFAVVEAMQDGQVENDLLERLGNDDTIPMTYAEIMEAVDKPLDLTGRAATQVNRFVAAAAEVVAQYPGAADYKPGAIL